MKKITLFILMSLVINAMAQETKEAVDIAIPIVDDSTDTDEVFTFVEQKAEFPDGEAALYKFLLENIKYPKNERTFGRIMIAFIVEKDGSISNIEIKKDLEKSVKEDIFRVIKLMPHWKPARQKGHIVRSKFTLSIACLKPQ